MQVEMFFIKVRIMKKETFIGILKSYRTILVILFVLFLIVFVSKGRSLAWSGTLEEKEFDVVLEFEGAFDFSASKIDKTMRDSIIANVLGDRFVRYGNKRVMKKYAKATLETFVETTDSVVTGVILRTQLDGSIVCADEEYITFKRILSTNTSAEEDAQMMTCNYYVFDAKTGQRIQEKDIFSSQDMNVIHKMLVESVKEKAEQDGIELDYRRIYPNGNFTITDSTITYIFNPYEIAHPSVGFVEITIDNIKTN